MADGAAGGRKAVFITGGASGIGLAAARRFGREGWFVGLGDIDASGLQTAVESIGQDRAAGFPLDVRDRAAWGRAMEGFLSRSGGRLDVLLNNAGIARYGWLEEVGPDDSDLMVDINVKGVINGAQAGLEALRATAAAHGSSQLINVASCAGVFGSPRLAVYCATKFAVKGLSESLDAEFSRFGVGVKCIMPWFVDTPILSSGARGGNATLQDAIKAGGSPVYTVEEAAEVIWRAMGSDKLHHMVGKAAERMRFAARFTPQAVRRQLRRSAQAASLQS